jgi:hypothetical protein
MAIKGVQRQSTMAIFTWLEELVMIQKRVISAAVPAVVLIEISGVIGTLL